MPPKKFRLTKNRVRVHPEVRDHAEEDTDGEEVNTTRAQPKVSGPSKPKVAPEEVEQYHLAPMTTELNLDTQFERDIELYEMIQNEGEDKKEGDPEVEDIVIGEEQPYDDPERQLWSSEIDFLLSIIGFAVDIANIWNFPHLCAQYGGGLFLIPYLTILITCGIPIFYMELIVGQYVRQGCISVWKLCPLFKGVGVCMTLVSYMTQFSYNVVLAWSLIYVYESTQAPLEWTKCGDASNHKDVYWTDLNCTSMDDLEKHQTNESIPNAADQFFKRKILGVYEVYNRTVTKMYTIDELGHPDDSLAVILLLVYIILLLVLIFGIKVTGKVVWITATLPYLILGILLFRGLTLPGARDGLSFFLRGNATFLSDIHTWKAAGTQVFYSLGAGFGIHLTLSSFNKFHHNLLFDCIVTAGINTLTSILAGIVIFSFLGNMSYSIRAQMISLSQSAQGPHLVFELFPQAIGRLPGANFFALIFFLLIFIIGIDTSMCAIQSIQVAFIDNFKVHFDKHAHSKEVFMFVLIISSFFFGLICVTHGGIFMFQVFDGNTATVSLIAATLFQCVGLAWVFGTQNLCAAAEAMTGQYPSVYFIICWKFVTPLFLIAILAFNVIDVFSSVPKYDGVEVSTSYFALGVCLALLPLLCIPITAFCVLRRTKTSDACKSRFILAISPEHEHEEIRRTGIASRSKVGHYFWMKWGHKKAVGPREMPQDGQEAQGKASPDAATTATVQKRRKSAASGSSGTNGIEKMHLA